MSVSRLFTVAVCATLVSSTLSHCVTYGYCGTDDMSGKRLPCAIKRVPAAMESELLESSCPALVSTKGRPALACCDREQAYTIKSQLKKLIYLGVRSDSECFLSFQNVVCQAVCSPYQSHFVAVFANRTEGNSPNPSATAIVYAVETTFAEQVYNACKDVRTYVLGRKLMKYMCGNYRASECSAQRFLDFVGAVHSEGGHSPFKIYYVLTDVPISVNGRRLKPFKPDHDLFAQKPNAGAYLQQ
uniref:Putative sine oculis-related homeobox 6b n=1 Tax=Rhipicephalus pulchellus TaxID=72859 RepID=L7M3Y8_RHIPC